MNDTEQIFLENGTVWFVSTSGYSGRDKLRPEDIGKTPDEILDIIQLGSKKIIPDDVRIRLNKPRSQVTSLMDKVGKHFLHFKGAWFVPNSRFMLAKEGLDNIQANANVILDDFIENLPQIKEEMIAEYPMLATAEWPTEKKIRRRFGVSVTVCQVQGVSIQETDAEELAEAKRKFQQDLNESYEEYKEQILIEAKIAIIEACQEISDRLAKGEKITENSLKKPKRVVDDYLNIAEIFDIASVKLEVNNLKMRLNNIAAEQLRNDYSVAQAFAKNMKDIAGSIGDLSGIDKDGLAKRTVKREVA